jgi:Uma2 family endonuclease
MTAVSQRTLSVEEYLEFEQVSETRHEFLDGTLHAMAGETQEHEEIVLNIAEVLRPVARAKGYRLYTTTIKLRVVGSRYRYPDVMVMCVPKSESRIESEPCLVIEVLSSSTESVDMNDKLAEYTRLPSLQWYVMVSQHRRLVTVYSRSVNGWEVQVLEENGEIDLPCLQTTLTLGSRESKNQKAGYPPKTPSPSRITIQESHRIRVT